MKAEANDLSQTLDDKSAKEMNKRIRIIKHAGRGAQRDNKDAADKQECISPTEVVSSLATGKIVRVWINELRRKKMTDLAVAHALKDSLTKIG